MASSRVDCFASHRAVEDEMAYEGELVKMANGRWARFTQLKISNAGHQDLDDTSILVAVELDVESQELLKQAEVSLEAYRRREEEEASWDEGPVAEAAVH
jgi:hypothetical protein